MDTAIASLFAKHFIARPDVKAIQRSDGSYNPIKERFTKQDLLNHLTGVKTYGHYLINPKTNCCKLFAFDLDLTQQGYLPDDIDSYGIPTGEGVVQGNPREKWRDRSYIGRSFLKAQLVHTAGLIASKTHKELEVPVAIAYSGYKGLHVYCFTGNIQASKAREGARLVMDLLNAECTSNNNYRLDEGVSNKKLYNVSIEVFPKQDKVENSQYGNLMRLPLGKHLKSEDPTFFVDLTYPPASMTPVKKENIAKYIENGDPWC